jgi:hypothetical protein
VHALCNVYALITNGLLRDGERADDPAESFTAEYVPVFPPNLLNFSLTSVAQRKAGVPGLQNPP